MLRLRARTYAYLIGIGTPMLLAGVLWWFRRQGGQAAPSDQLFALVIGAAMLGTAGILLKRSLPTLAASLALLILGFPQEVLGSVILPSGGLYLIAAFIVGLTDIGEMVGEGIEAGKEGMEESGMNAPEMPSAFQDATDGGEAETAEGPEQAVPDAEAPDTPAQPVPDAEAPDGPAQPVDADDVDPITTEAESDPVDEPDSASVDDVDETPDPEEVVEEHGPHHAPEVQVDQDRIHADDPSVGQIGGDEAADGEDAAESADTDEIDDPADEIDQSETDDESDAADIGAEATDTDDTATPTGVPVERPGNVDALDDPAEAEAPEMEETPDPDSAMASKTLSPDEPGAEDTGPVESDPVETDATDDHGHPDPVRSVEPAGEESGDDTDEDADETGDDEDTETSNGGSS